MTGGTVKPVEAGSDVTRDPRPAAIPDKLAEARLIAAAQALYAALEDAVELLWANGFSTLRYEIALKQARDGQ